MKTHFTLRVDEDVLQRVTQLATAENRTKAQMVEVLLIEALNGRGGLGLALHGKSTRKRPILECAAPGDKADIEAPVVAAVVGVGRDTDGLSRKCPKHKGMIWADCLAPACRQDLPNSL